MYYEQESPTRDDRFPLYGVEPMDAYERDGDELDYMDCEEEEDIERCEADYKDDVCLARVTNGRCVRGHGGEEEFNGARGHKSFDVDEEL